jgi:4-amino-4-deoxy-L-arabinose transferase-like glycosyltransferase
MSAGTSVIRIEEAFLSPRALPPPPTRHALFAIVVTMAALIHIGSIGIGDLYSETEGQYAAAAREMLQSGHWLMPTNDSIPRLQKPPLLYWLIIASYKIFGVNAAAARLPIALSVVVTTALTFLIGERLRDYWRGFVAALIYLTCSATFVLARIVMPEPLFSALIAGAIFCGLAGFQERKQRSFWFAGFWICAGLACMTKGPHGLLVPAFTFIVLAFFYREARMRFHALVRWPYLVLFALIVAPWNIWMETHFNGSFYAIIFGEWIKHLLGRYPDGTWFDDVPRFQFAVNHLAWWFPWVFVILPALLFSWRRVIRPAELTLEDALPMVWAAVVFVPVLIIGQRQDYYALSMLSAFALCAATIFERAPNFLRYAGAGAIASIGVFIGAIGFALPSLLPAHERSWGETDFRWTAWKALSDMPVSTWIHFRPLLFFTALALIAGALLTIYIVRSGREELAAVGVAAGMVVAGFCMISGVARVAPYFSLANAARFLNARLDTKSEVIFEGSPGVASSLGYYLQRPFTLVNQAPDPRLPLTPEQRDFFLDETSTLERWRAPRPVFLIIEQDRVNHWRELLTGRFHVYHQVATCGTYVVLSNQM